MVWKASFKGGLLDGDLTSYYANDQKMARVSYREGAADEVPHDTLAGAWTVAK